MQHNPLTLQTKTILFVEDDDVMREHTAETLKMLFKKVLLAKNGVEALVLYEKGGVDFVLTDIKMPDMNGLELTKRIREHDYYTPVIMLTGFAEQDMMLSASNLSIDGYIIKPIELDSLVRCFTKAANRAPKQDAQIRIGNGVTYDVHTQELYKNGVLVALGYKEHALVSLFIKNHKKTLSKDEIVNKLWPLEPICESALKNLVLRIRKKIGFDLIVSVRSIGYRLRSEDIKA
jgi:two-component system, OmpR family, response regulator VanR